MAWTAPRTWVAGEVPTAAIFNTHLRDNLLALQPVSNTVAASQGTASTTYTDLATVGPAVTVTTGASALVVLTASAANSGIQQNFMSFAVSGATTVAAADANGYCPSSSTATAAYQASAVIPITGLTPGSNTFTAKYRAGANTATFVNRSIIVIAPF